jgi:hypothetical protein
MRQQLFSLMASLESGAGERDCLETLNGDVGPDPKLLVPSKIG